MREDRRLVVFYHGNSKNLGLHLDYFQMLYQSGNCDVLVVAYRGYSASSGTPDEEGLKVDGKAILSYAADHLARHYVDRGGVFVIGRSLGGAVATASVAAIR